MIWPVPQLPVVRGFQRMLLIEQEVFEMVFKINILQKSSWNTIVITAVRLHGRGDGTEGALPLEHFEHLLPFVTTNMQNPFLGAFLPSKKTITHSNKTKQNKKLNLLLSQRGTELWKREMLDTQVLWVCDLTAGAVTAEVWGWGCLPSRRRTDEPDPPLTLSVTPCPGGSHVKTQGDIQGVFPSQLDKQFYWNCFNCFA